MACSAGTIGSSSLDEQQWDVDVLDVVDGAALIEHRVVDVLGAYELADVVRLDLWVVRTSLLRSVTPKQELAAVNTEERVMADSTVKPPAEPPRIAIRRGSTSPASTRCWAR